MRVLVLFFVVGFSLSAACCSPETSRTASAEASARTRTAASQESHSRGSQAQENQTKASQPDRLPGAVEATLDQLKLIAANGDYHALAKLASVNPDFRSNAGGMSHLDYWRLKTSAGDDPTEHLARILAYHPAIASSSDGEVYIWPWLA